MIFTDQHWAKVLGVISFESYRAGKKRDEVLRDNWSNLEDESWCDTYLDTAQIERLRATRGRLSAQIDEIDAAIAELEGQP